MNCKTACEPQACVTMPFYECQEGIYEIDEFDCASIFVVVGEARALVIDTGIGIGDLKWLIENRITDKPYDVVLTHNHVDHMGGAAWFDRVYIHPDDMVQTDTTASPTLALRRSFAELFRVREHRHYLYDAERDIRPWPRQPLRWSGCRDPALSSRASGTCVPSAWREGQDHRGEAPSAAYPG